MNELLFKDDYMKVPDISGLIYYPSFITKEEEQVLIQNIDSQSWITDLKRRVQHCGYKYDYKARSVSPESYLGPLPNFLESLITKLERERLFLNRPDQVIVNEYQPGQGISAHTDCVPCFGDVIASLSLGSSCIMEFSNPKVGQKEELFLEPRSLVLFSGEARYTWRHCIPARKSDKVNGFRIERARRLSLTFRTIKFD